MNVEAAFLAQITAMPDDLAPWLVYADWLQERDGPRGELIHVLEAMRTLDEISIPLIGFDSRRVFLDDTFRSHHGTGPYLGQPPVHHPHFAELANHDVTRLEIAVDNIPAMRVCHR